MSLLKTKATPRNYWVLLLRYNLLSDKLIFPSNLSNLIIDFCMPTNPTRNFYKFKISLKFPLKPCYAFSKVLLIRNNLLIGIKFIVNIIESD